MKKLSNAFSPDSSIPPPLVPGHMEGSRTFALDTFKKSYLKHQKSNPHSPFSASIITPQFPQVAARPAAQFPQVAPSRQGFTRLTKVLKIEEEAGSEDSDGGPESANDIERDELMKISQNKNANTLYPTDAILHRHMNSEASIGLCGQLLLIVAYFSILVTFPFSLLVCIKVIQEYERAVIFRLGRIAKGGARGPGICFVMPCLDEIYVIDMRTISFDVPPQEILTKDSVTVSVDAVVYFRISSAVASVCNVEGVQKSTRLLAQTTLRNILGTKSLSDLLAEREAISQEMQYALDQATDPWGVVVERIEIKDVRLPANLQRAMAAEAEAFREAKAKEIAADGEKNAAQALKDASDTMMESSCAVQLRYLQTLTTIASEQNSTIVFPVPVDMFSVFAPRPKLKNKKNQTVDTDSDSDSDKEQPCGSGTKKTSQSSDVT